MGKGVLVSLNKVYFSSNQPRSIRRVMSPIVFRRDFDEDSDKIFIRGLVVLDRFVQCRFVLDEVLPSTIVIPPHLERTCSELEAFLDLRSVFFLSTTGTAGEREDSDLHPELITGALSCGIEGQFSLFCIVVATDD